MKTGKLIGRRILLLAALIALALPATLQAQFTFITNNGAITITKYTGPGGTVVIPSITNGYPVTTIGASAFLTITNVTNVTIPDSISSIYDDAFDDSGLRSVAIPNSVTNLGAFVFDSCSGLKNATIGNSVINIGQSAFWACGSLTNVIIGNSVTNIGLYAFTACSGL
jgi:Na+-translocating ferredoxin:NAD+ oxidoreductase RnfD subunit